MQVMNSVLFVFLFFTIAIAAYRVEDENGIIFIGGLIRKVQPEGQIIYTDKINKGLTDKIKSSISKSIIRGISEDTKKNSITLSRQEKKYILDQLENCSRPYWGENLFPNSKMIREEELLSHIKKAHEEYSDNYNNPNNTGNDKLLMIKNYQKPNVFEFSCPVYIRNNSYCFIYFSSICGNPCGFDELSIYKKENDKWIKWIVVSAREY